MLMDTTKLSEKNIEIDKKIFGHFKGQETVSRSQVREAAKVVTKKKWAPVFIVKNVAFQTSVRGQYRLPAALGGPKGIKGRVLNPESSTLMKTKRTHVVLSEQLVKEIDAVVGRRQRSSFISQAAEKEL